MSRGGGTRSGFLGCCRSGPLGLCASRGRLIGRRRRLGRHYARSTEFARFRGGRDRRLAMIHRLVQLMVAAGALNMLSLHRGWRGMSFTSGLLFHRSRTSGQSPGASVVAHIYVIDGHVLGIDVGDVRDVVHGSVVEECSTFPIAALIADATVAEAVVDAAIESHFRAPVTFVKSELATAPAPVTRGPEETRLRRHGPRTRYPEVAFLSVSPVSGRPDVACVGTNGLLVHRKRWWSEPDGENDLRRRCHWESQYHECEQER